MNEQKVAILIGINKYRDNSLTLVNSVNDVQAVATVLKKSHNYEIYSIIDEAATLNGITSFVRDISTKITNNHRVIFYFAGHGIAVETNTGDPIFAAGPQGYLIPQDAVRGQVDTYWKMHDLQAQLQTLLCRHLLMVLDCCFSGAFRWSKMRHAAVHTPPMLYRERYERYLRDPARQVITSTAHDEPALDVLTSGRRQGERNLDENNSPFAVALCQGLEGAADLRPAGGSGSGVILANELHLYIEKHFRQLEIRHNQILQKPMIWSLPGHERGQYIFWTPGRDLSLQSAIQLNEKTNPFRGLEPYEEDTANLFHGRKRTIENLSAAVAKNSFTIVIGESGSGKTSLVRAGLVPSLRKSREPIWHIIPLMRFGNKPLDALCEIVKKIATDQSELTDAIAQWQRKHPVDHLIIIIDQLEELLDVSLEERKAVLTALIKLPESCGERIHVVATLRSDLEALFPDLLLGERDKLVTRFRIPLMTRAELREVIEESALEYELYFEPPTLIDALIDEVIDAPGALPLLSFTLSYMYRDYLAAQRQDRLLRGEDYEKMNGVAGCLSQHAEAVYDSLDEQQKRICDNLLMRMIRPGELIRRRVLRNELMFVSPNLTSLVNSVVDRLLEARLLVTGNDNTNIAYIELAHDKLVLSWPRLRILIDKEQELLPLHHRLIVAAQEWSEKKESWLLWNRDPRLPQAQTTLRQRPFWFNQNETQFLHRSIARRYRLRLGIGSSVLAIIVALSGLAAYAFRQRATAEDQRRQSEARRQEADRERYRVQWQLAQTHLEQGYRRLSSGYPQQALAYLAEAYRLGPQEPEPALRFLLKVAAQQSRPLILKSSSGYPTTVAFSPDDTQIAVGNNNGNIELWDAKSGKFVYLLKSHKERVNEIIFGYRKKLLASASADDDAIIWDIGSQKIKHVLHGHNSSVDGLNFNEDESQIISAGEDGTARIWNAETGKLIKTLIHQYDDVWHGEFIKSSPYIITADEDHKIHIWSRHNYQRLQTIRSQCEGHGWVRLARQAPLLITASRFMPMTSICNLSDGSTFATLRGNSAVSTFADFSFDARKVVTTGKDKTARIWDTATGTHLASLEGLILPTEWASFSHDGTRLAVTNGDGTVRVFEISGPKTVAIFEQPVEEEEAAHHYEFAIDQQATKLITDFGHGAIYLWDFKSAKLINHIKLPTQHVQSLSFSPDGRHLLTLGDEGPAAVWDVSSMKMLHTFNFKARPLPNEKKPQTDTLNSKKSIWNVSSMNMLHAFNFKARPLPNGKMPQPGMSNNDKYVAFINNEKIIIGGTFSIPEIWDLRTGQLIKDLIVSVPPAITTTSISGTNKFEISADGKILIIRHNDKFVSIWDLMTNEIIAQLEDSEQPIYHLAISPNHQLIITSGESSDGSTIIKFWKYDNGSLIKTLSLGSHLGTKLLLSHNGRFLLVTGGEADAVVLSIPDGKIIATLSGHRGTIWKANFSFDDNFIITAGRDDAACLWALPSGLLLSKLQGHRAIVDDVALVPDGTRAITSSADGTIRIWDISLEQRSPAEFEQTALRENRFHLEQGKLVSSETLMPAGKP